MPALPQHYNYIIAGAGCAGMSLLMRMMQDPFFNNKKILVIDREQKSTNDRTWCFWEKTPGIFESIVTHSWSDIELKADNLSIRQSILPYQYKMIQGIDLYHLVRTNTAAHTNIEWLQDEIISVDTEKTGATVQTANGSYMADWVFSSIMPTVLLSSTTTNNKYHLLQHFTGWMIETTEPQFNSSVATFMDFRVPQDKGTAFMYLLPTAPNRALVEYTLFTENLLATGEYEKAIKDYLDKYFPTRYHVVHAEHGVIPMTNHRFPLQQQRIVYMGTAGGQVKGSSGYAFQFIQKRTKGIVDGLTRGADSFSKQTLADRKFRLYDSVLLHVLTNKKMPGAKLFAELFYKNKAKDVLQFLDNETNIFQDLSIMRTVPSRIFLPAALYELMH